MSRRNIIILVVTIGSVSLLVKLYSDTKRSARLKDEVYKMQDGDIIFQTSQSSQSKAIQLATHSKYSHCGIIYWDNTQCYVLEASKKVSMTPIHDFINKGVDGHFVIKRLSNAKTVFNSPKVVQRLDSIFSTSYAGKPYDIYFEWNSDKIYCSELVWKIYKDALGIEVGRLQKLQDFDLSAQIVRDKMEERFHGDPPLDEPVISPVSIFNSDKLVTIVER